MQCKVQNKTTYNIPAYLPAERKAELLVNLEKGKKLFKTNCSKCHGIFKKGKDSIPNFTNKEITDYATAFKAFDKKNHAVAKKLLPEEMSMIITFLQLRKIDSLPQHSH
jgi:cytochrome c2